MSFKLFPILSHPYHFIGLLFSVEDSSATDPTRACGVLGIAKVAFWVIVSISISILAGYL